MRLPFRWGWLNNTGWVWFTIIMFLVFTVKKLFFSYTTEGSLVDTGAYQPYTLAGPPVWRLVLAPLAVYNIVALKTNHCLLYFKCFPFSFETFLLFFLQGHSFSMFVKEDYLILHYLFLSCLFVAIAVDVLSFLLTHWTAVVVWLVPIRWLVCLNKTYFYPSLNVSTFM